MKISTGQLRIAGSSLIPQDKDGAKATADLGSTSHEWRDLFLGDSSNIYFGAAQEMDLYYLSSSTEGIGLALTSSVSPAYAKMTNGRIFLDVVSGTPKASIGPPASGRGAMVKASGSIYLEPWGANESVNLGVSQDSAETMAAKKTNVYTTLSASAGFFEGSIYTGGYTLIESGSITTNEDLIVSGTLSAAGAVGSWGFSVDADGDTALKSLAVDDGSTIGCDSDTDLLTLAAGALTAKGTITVGVNDSGHDVKFFGATDGAYMLWDESADDLKLVGAAGMTIASDLDVDGTTNLDAVDIDGAVQIDGATTFGVNDTGVDVKMFGATSGSFLLWDESADSLLLTDSTPIKIGDAQDMTLYHDGSNSYITNAVGALKIATETSGIAVTIGHATSSVTVADDLSISGDAAVAGTLSVAADLVHTGDTNNKIAFGTDTQSFETGGSARMNISDSGLQIGAGARVTTIENSDSLGTSDTKLCTQGNVKAYVDSVDRHVTDLFKSSADAFGASALGTLTSSAQYFTGTLSQTPVEPTSMSTAVGKHASLYINGVLQRFDSGSLDSNAPTTPAWHGDWRRDGQTIMINHTLLSDDVITVKYTK